MRAVRLGLVVIAVAAVTSCGGDNAATPTTALAPQTTAPVPPTTPTYPPARMPVFADDDEPIALDPDTTTGVLDNGLTYYIRENAAPGGRAQLRLVVQAGSAHESDEQAGVAHYLEHMLFNGTERFPANELVAVLQRFGAEFGPDINAYTAYDETVYMIELPTDDAGTVATGFDVLLEWASAATLDPDEVESERGVLLEEWRLRDQGFWGRYVAAVTDLLLAGTPYDGHLPLAAPEQLEATTPEGIRDFYMDWYRPDLIGIVAVGDFDAAVIEDLIIDRFAGLAVPEGAPPVPELGTSPFAEPEFLLLPDPEAESSFVELNYPVATSGRSGTVGALRRDFALSAAFDMLATRLHEDTLRGVTPYFDPSRASNEFVRTQGTDGLFAYANPESLTATAEALLIEMERARRFGFNQSELDRVVGDLRADVQSQYDERGSKQDWSYAADYVEHFLSGAPAAEALALRDLQLRLIAELTTQQVRDTFAATIETTQPLVIVAAPEAYAADMPDEAALADMLAAVAVMDLEARPDDVTAADALMEPPAAAEVAAEHTLEGTVIPILEFANGAWFIAWPTDIHEGHAEFIAGSPGGWVTLADGDVTEARLLDDLMLRSGVAGFDQVDLERILNGTDVELRPYVDEVWEGWWGGADTVDLETLFQLVHLYVSEPRFDPVAVPIVQNRFKQSVEHPETLVDTALDKAIAEARFPGDPRFVELPSVDELAELDLERAAAVFESRFADAGDFVFVLVGDFDPDRAEEFARRYLGTLPGGGQRDRIRDDRPPSPAGIEAITVEAGSGQRGAYTLTFTTEGAHDPDRRVRLDILEAVIDQRLTTHIREELSASYSPSVNLDQVDDPTPGVVVSIRVDGDPAGIDTVSEALLADLADLIANGPTADEFAIAQEQVFRDYELISNLQLAQRMLRAAFVPEDLVTEIIDRFDRVPVVTRSQIEAIAAEVITLDEYIEVRLVPIGFTE